MSKVAVIVCSNAGLDYLDHPKDITIFRSKIHFGDDSYDDYVQMDGKTFYERLEKNPNIIPKTSYVSIGYMIETFEKLAQQGYDEAFVITIAKPLSGLYDAIVNVSKQVDLKVTVFDSRILTYPESYMALTAHQMFADGKSTEDVINKLEFIRDHQKVYFVVDTLLFLVKNGRLSKFQGTMGTLLKIKPLLAFSPEGKVENFDKVRTTARAYRRIVDLYLEGTKDKDVITYISHANNQQGAIELTKMIHEVYPERKIVTTFLTPVVGAHTGPGAIGLGYIEK